MLKFLPTSLYNVPAVETWLQDQARRGRHATGFFCGGILRFGMMRFRRGEPQEARYRLEPQLRRERPDPEMLALYAARGWTFVDNTGDFYLWRTDRRSAGELHTDPVAESFSYDWLAQVQGEQMRLTGAIIFAMLAMSLLFWCMDHQLLLPLIGAGMESGQILFLVLAFRLLRDLSEFRAIRKLRRQLGAGIPITHAGAPYRAHQWIGRGMRVLLAGLILCIAWTRQGITAEWAWTDFPVPPAAALGVDVPLRPPMGFREGGTLMAEELSAIQSREDASGQMTTVWSADVYDLRLPFLAGPVLGELAYSEITYELGEAPVRLENTPFDEARYLRADDGTQYLAARLDGWVLLYRADVPADLRDHLADFAAALSAV